MVLSGSAVIVTDETGVILSANVATVTMFSYSFAELMGSNVTLLMPDTTAKQHASYMANFLKSGVAKVVDKTRVVVGKRKDGKLLTLKLSLSMLRLEEGGRPKFIGMLQPVPRATIKIKTDNKCNITFASQNSSKLLGYSRKELIGQNVSVLCPEPHRQNHNKYVQQFFATKKAKVLGKSRNLMVERKNGSQVPIALQVRQTHHGFKGYIHLLEGRDCMVTVSSDGVIRNATDAARELFGRLPEQMAGERFDDLFEGVSVATMPSNVVFEARLRCLDGALINVGVEKGDMVDSNDLYCKVTAAIASTSEPTSSDSDQGSGSDSSGSTSEKEDLGMYEMEGVLGTGFFGSVRLATHKLSGMMVAIKKLSADQFREVGLKFPPLEVELLMSVPGHPNLMQLFDIIETKSRVFLIQEFVNGGELFDYVMSSSTGLPTPEVERIFRQIVRGVAWLHDHGQVHRDLKLENVLLDKDGNAKIIDLGLGQFYQRQQHLSTFCGSPDYAAPELFMRKLYLGPPVDIWALGVLLYVMATSFIPFDSPQRVVDVSYGWPANRPDARIVDLCRQIFKFKPTDRITMKGIRAHDFIRLPVEEKSELTDEALDHEVIGRVALELGLEKELVVQSVSIGNGCNSIAASYKMLLAKKRKKQHK